MEKLLITMMLRNNEHYLSYLFRCLDLVEEKNKEYKIDYLFYTNNNDDNTLELLQNYSKGKENIEIINKDYGVDFNKENRLLRLYFLRQDFLEIIRSRMFDYILMLDTDIYFNEKMIRRSIEIMKEKKLNTFSANTLAHNNPFYYDLFSLSDKNNKGYTTNILSDRKLLSFHLSTLFNRDKIQKVGSCFGGFFITTKEVIDDRNNNYFVDKKDIDIKVCEHKIFNKNLEINFANNINPYRIDTPEKRKKAAESAMKIIEKNECDNRFFFYFFFQYIGPVLLIILAIYIYFKYR